MVEYIICTPTKFFGYLLKYFVLKLSAIITEYLQGPYKLGINVIYIYACITSSAVLVFKGILKT